MKGRYKSLTRSTQIAHLGLTLKKGKTSRNHPVALIFELTLVKFIGSKTKQFWLTKLFLLDPR